MSYFMGSRTILVAAKPHLSARKEAFLKLLERGVKVITKSTEKEPESFYEPCPGGCIMCPVCEDLCIRIPFHTYCAPKANKPDIEDYY